MLLPLLQESYSRPDARAKPNRQCMHAQLHAAQICIWCMQGWAFQAFFSTSLAAPSGSPALFLPASLDSGSPHPLNPALPPVVLSFCRSSNLASPWAPRACMSRRKIQLFGRRTPTPRSTTYSAWAFEPAFCIPPTEEESFVVQATRRFAARCLAIGSSECAD